MLFFVLLTYFAGLTLFSVGGAGPATGLEEVQQAPLVAPAGKPSLTIKPLHLAVIVAGRGFKPGEMVRLTGGSTVRVRASARGTFQVRLRHGDPCGSLTVQAVGSKGSRATGQHARACVEQ